MKPHICHVFPSFTPGGAQVRTCVVMNGLAGELRHTVIAVDDVHHCDARLDAGVEREYVKAERGKWGKLYPLHLGGKLKKLEPDLTLVYNWGAFDAAMGAVLRRVRPWAAVIDGFGGAEAQEQQPLRLRLRRWFYRRADAVVVVSHGLVETARTEWEVPENRIFHLANGIDTGHFTPGPADDVRKGLGLTDQDVLLGTVAHIRNEKNPRLLLEAFLEIAEHNPRLHLVYVGGIPGGLGVPRPPIDAQIYGRMLNRIEETGLKDRVHFPGRQEETAPWYRALDLFALSSHTEQMPLSVAEAMACGKPVLSTDVGDVKRMVCEENRKFVRSGTKDYTAALRALLADADLCERLGAQNRLRAVEHYDRRAMIEAYRRFFGRFCRLPQPVVG